MWQRVGACAEFGEDRIAAALAASAMVRFSISLKANAAAAT